jgi:hypothetical protein
MANSLATTKRCTCGYRFDVPDDDEERSVTAAQIAVEEKLFAEYLEARAAQAVEAATVAARAAELDPENERKAVEAVRTQQAAEKLAAELAVQRIKAAQAVHAAGPHTASPVWPPPPARPSNPPPNGRPRPSPGLKAQRMATTSPAQQTGRKPLPRQSRFSREPHTRFSPPGVAVTGGSRPLTLPKPTVSKVPAPGLQPRPPVPPNGATRPRPVATRSASPAVRKKPVRTTRPTWQAVVATTVSRAARTAAQAAARGAHKAAKGAAKATARTATKAAKHVARTTARAAQRAMQAARERREVKRVRTRARAIPVLTNPVAPASPPVPTQAFPERPTPMVAARRRAATPAAVQPPKPNEIRQRTQPSETFRRAQAAKIEQAVVAARSVESTAATVECALCSASLSVNAKRCLCGWQVPNHVRDIPALTPVAGHNGRNAHGNELTVAFRRIECPLCGAELAPNAVRCRCGWNIPEGTNELPPVSLTADEVSSLSFGVRIDNPNKSR